MSTSFEVFPTNNYIPNCDEIIYIALNLFRDFMKKVKVEKDINITVYEMYKEECVQENPSELISHKNGYNSFSINQIGNVFVYYHEHQEITKEFWEEEIRNNKKALCFKEQIENNLKIGYSWSIVRTAGQPVLVSLFYGYIAIALAKLTSGIIYSDDGAWEYSSFPICAEDFEKIYLDVTCITEKDMKETIENWILLCAKS